jgi:cell division septal protein FtsQ
VRATLLHLLPSGRSLAVGFGLLATACLLYFAARESSVFAVSSIDVQTEPRGHSRPVERALAPLQGTSLLEVGDGEISRLLDGLPHVHLLGYDRAFPTGLRVYVSVERPVAVLRRADENWLVSVEGRVLRKLETRLRRPLPVVWVPPGTEPEIGAIVDVEKPARAIAALAEIAVAAPGFYDRIWYVAPSEHGLTLVLDDRFEVRLGGAVELPLKLEVARRVLAELRATGDPAVYIDVAVPERPVAGATLNSQVER